MYTGSSCEWTSMVYGSLRPDVSKVELSIWTYPLPAFGQLVLSGFQISRIGKEYCLLALNSIQLCSVLRVASLELNMLSFMYLRFSLKVYVFRGTALY